MMELQLSDIRLRRVDDGSSPVNCELTVEFDALELGDDGPICVTAYLKDGLGYKAVAAELTRLAKLVDNVAITQHMDEFERHERYLVECGVEPQ